MLRYAESYDRWADTVDMVRGLSIIGLTGSYSTSGGAFGGGYLAGGGLAIGSWHPFFSATSGSLLRWAYWMKVTSASTYSNTVHRPITEFRDARFATTRYLMCRLNGAGATNFLQVGVYDDASNAAVAAAGTIGLGDNTWRHFEFEYVAHPTTGSIKVWVDGVLDINFSGDTSNAASGDTSGFVGMMIGGSSANSGSRSVDFDDILVWDDTGGAGSFVGRLPDKHRIRHITPAANGSQNDWTPNTGFNYQNVDETTIDGTTTYNYTDTNGAIDYYSFNNMSFDPQVIHAMVGEVFFRRDGIRKRGTFPTARAKLKRSGGVQNGNTKNIAPKYRRSIIASENDPVDSAPWTKGKFNTGQLELGIEKVS
jgi:hypothetical protein